MNRLVAVFSIKRKDLRTTCALLALVIPLAAFGQSASYKVSLDFYRPLHAAVEALIEAPDGDIFAADHAGGYAWWDFIKNLRQLCDDGSTVLLQPAGNGHWTLPTETVGFLRLNCDVDLSFTEKVREGDLRGGLFFGDSLYLVNRVLFLMSNAAGPKDIEFDTPGVRHRYALAKDRRSSLPRG